MIADARIAITGMGVMSPLGTDLETFHLRLRDGTDGISTIEPRYGTGYRVNHAGLVDLGTTPSSVEKPGRGRATTLALAAARSALQHAELDHPRCGVIVGTAMGDALELEATLELEASSETVASRRDLCGQYRVHTKISASLGLDGLSHLIATTCAAGNHAIDWACEILRAGNADAMLAVGADTIGHVDLLGFSRLLLQAPDAIRPFDLHRKGTILSEGAGALLLEPIELAQKRGAPILAEVAGCGQSCDASGAFQSKATDVRALLIAGEAALHQAELPADEIDYISAHGSGTRLNDSRETNFAKALLGDRAHQVPMSSIKSMLGHAQGAAASLEAIACVLSFEHDTLYPTINFETADPQCDMDCIPNRAREARVDVIMSNAFGIGGNNCVVLLKRWKGS